MYTDLLGKQRIKLNLHMHTTNSDGGKSPEDAVAFYKAAGYDAVALTDHWKFHPSKAIDGMRILSGIEYNIPGRDATVGVCHILGLGCKEEPNIGKEDSMQKMVDEIIRCGGLPVMAHPAWSLNMPEDALSLNGLEVTEIYNSVSDAHNSSRPYSGYFVDAVASHGKQLALLATDDTHFYDGSDDTKAWIMLECAADATDDALLQAIRDRKFYATQGPEVHIWREGDEVKLRCSPACRISLFSNIVINSGFCIRGENLTEHSCPIQPMQSYIRAEVTDAEGKVAWSNILDLR
ncbi:MAG: hypothetical protein E7470_09090 [Ruminococcaceae bacterium]|nr:hypothetical protein [Oscillospiraceae bacterium]